MPDTINELRESIDEIIERFAREHGVPADVIRSALFGETEMLHKLGLQETPTGVIDPKDSETFVPGRIYGKG